MQSRSEPESLRSERLPPACSARDRTLNSATGTRGWSERWWLQARQLHPSNILLPRRRHRVSTDRASREMDADPESIGLFPQPSLDKQKARPVSRIKGEKLLAIFRFAERQLFAQDIDRQCTVLKAPLGEHRHREAGYRRYAARNNLTL